MLNDSREALLIGRFQCYPNYNGHLKCIMIYFWLTWDKDIFCLWNPCI